MPPHAIALTALTSWLAASTALAAGAAASGLLSEEIPAQPLEQALTQFADETGLQVVYVAALARGATSHRVSAEVPPEAALEQLLQGTGLRFAFLNERVVKIIGQPQLEKRVWAPRESPAEVTVTATKRPEALYDVALSVDVFSAAELKASGIHDVAGLAARVPGLEYDSSSQFGPGTLSNISIRGVDSNVGAPTTGIYLDDVPIQARATYFGNPYPVTFDLERVEVLRGPQGTLFGAGAEGGAIRFVTQSASTDSYGSEGRTELATTQNGGLSYEIGVEVHGPLIQDYLGGRMSAIYRQDGGFVDHVNPFDGAVVGNNSNRSADRAFRLTTLLQPTEGLRLTPSLSYQSVTIADTPSFYLYLSDPQAGRFLNGKLLRQPASDSFTTAALKAEDRLGSVQITAVTSFFDRTAGATVDSTNAAGAVFFGGFGSPQGAAYPTSYAQAVPSQVALRQTLWCEELRATSEDLHARVRWTVGTFLGHSRQQDSRDTYEIADPLDPGILSRTVNTDVTMSGFGNLALLPLEGLRIQAGGRLDYRRNDFTEHDAGFAFPDLPAISHTKTHETPFTPQFAIAFKATERDLVYASVSEGFRSGGGNVPVPSGCADQAPKNYASDSLWSYEVGGKLAAFDERVQVGTSAYYLRWKRIQEHVVLACSFGYVANLGDAIGKGFDLTLDLFLTPSISAGLSLGLVDVRYASNSAVGDTVIADRGTVVGGVPSVPAPWNGVAFVAAERPLAGELRAYSRIEDVVHSHNTGPFSELDPRANNFDPGYRADPATSVLNVQCGIKSARTDIRLFVNNVLNTHPVLQVDADAHGSNLSYAYTFRPRTIGFMAVTRF